MHRRYGSFAVFSVAGAIFSTVPMFLPAKTSKAEKPSNPVEAVPTPVASSSPVTPDSLLNSSPLVTLLLVLAIVILFGLLITGIFLVMPRIMKAANAKSENIGAWKDLIKRYADIRAQWASYEMDMSKIIDFPVMTDMREPVIIALHKALKTASSLAPKSLGKLAYTPVRDSAFLAAVNDLEIAFNSAEQEAKKIAWSKFTKEERRSLSTAKQMLSLAMDAGASPAERQAAYKRVFKELQGLIEFPAKARLEIEAKHQLSLVA